MESVNERLQQLLPSLTKYFFIEHTHTRMVHEYFVEKTSWQTIFTKSFKQDSRLFKWDHSRVYIFVIYFWPWASVWNHLRGTIQIPSTWDYTNKVLSPFLPVVNVSVGTDTLTTYWYRGQVVNKSSLTLLSSTHGTKTWHLPWILVLTKSKTISLLKSFHISGDVLGLKLVN